MKKFASSSRFKARPSTRVLWLDTRSQTIYWQKGKKNLSKVKSDASLRLSDIVKVTEGISTPTLKKSGSEDKGDHYLSLVGKGNTRTLDMEMPSQFERNDLVKGFRLLLAGR
jgi:hypothetical protein